MQWRNFKANSEAGWQAIKFIMSLDERRQRSRKMFTQFIEANGFSAFHIHDGWVMFNYESGEVLHNEQLRIVWIDDHAGYSHTPKHPKVGEKLVIIKDTPDFDRKEPFDLYCYDVIESVYKMYLEIKVKRIDVKKVVFNVTENRYEFYQSKIMSFKQKIKRFFNLLTTKR